MKKHFEIALSTGLIVLMMTSSPAPARAQATAARAGDLATRVTAVLPPDAARQVLGVIDDARANSLPSDAIANRSLKFAARGIAPGDIARAATEQLARMKSVRDVLSKARGGAPSGNEIEAGAEALREGVAGADVSKLARSAPSGRSLTVPLYVIGSLVSRGLPSDDALQRVQSKLLARASDTDIESVGRDAAASHGASGEEHGRGLGIGRSGGVGSATHGPPAGVPGNAGGRGRSGKPGAPPGPPPGKGRP